MRLRRRVALPAGVWYLIAQVFDDPADRLGVVVIRAEIPAFGESGAFNAKLFRQHQIPRQRFQHMLPGSCRQRRADGKRAPGIECAQEIRNQPIRRPVAAADDVAGTGAGQMDAGCVEEGGAVSGGDQFGTGLAAGIGIGAAHGFVFAVGPDPFAVVVALVGGDVDHGLDAGRLAHRFQQVDRAHDVDGVGFHRRGVGVAHQRLGGQMQHDVGPRSLHGAGQCLGVAQVGEGMAGKAGLKPCDREEIRLGRRRQRIAMHFRAHVGQPQAQPAALEAGVAGHEDALAAPEFPLVGHAHGQVFQGALPEVQRSSSRFFSRSVSIGCQNPSCSNAMSSPCWLSRVSGSPSQLV